MMLYNVILLLLYWPCVRSATVDHENTLPSLSNANHKMDNTFYSSSMMFNGSSVKFENSNGFVPMVPSVSLHHSLIAGPPKLQESYSIKNPTNSPNDLKLILNISRSDASRRQDLQNDQKEFELLKVNEKIPAVANYHEFYDNLRKSKESNTNHNYNPGNFNNKKYNYYGTKERMKQIEDYLNYDNQHGENVKTVNIPNLHHDKLSNNYHQYGLTDYGTNGESVTKFRPTTPPPIKYYSNKNNWNTQAAETNRHEKPVIVSPSDYKVNLNYNSQPAQVSTISPVYKQDRNLSEDRYDRSEDYSDENSDYYEVTERSRKLHKSRRKPSDTSRKLPREHRGDDMEEWKKVNAASKTKSNRGRGKPNYWNNNNQQSQDDNSEEKESQYREEKNENNKEKPNSWSQVAPNIEFSPSNGYELSPLDKSNVLVPVNFNLVPVTNFDHNTALGSSQGFDVSNAGIPNFISPGSIVSTAAPLVSRNPPIIMQTTPSTPLKNVQNNYAYPTISDIIVGQNAYQTPIQTLLLPQVNSKYNTNVKAFIQSTASPLYALNPTMQSLTTQSTTAPKATQVTGPQLFYPSSTVQPYYHTPVPAATNYNIVVNPYGLNGQNNPIIASNSADTKKSTFNGSSDQLLASASYSVGNAGQSNNANNNNNNNNNNNKYYLPITNANQATQIRPQIQNMYPIYKNDNALSKIKTFVPAQLVPTFIQAAQVPGVNVFNGQAQGQYNVGNNILENTWSQLRQLQANEQQRYHYPNIYGKDNIGSTSNNNENTINMIQNSRAQLPVVGMQNVEILNPNLTPLATPLAQYPIVTTPFPIVSTVITQSPLPTPTSIATNNIQNYVDSLTQIGTRPINQDPSVYNPMNFVPNNELIKSQTILNGKIPEPLPPALNLVPIAPGGKFYKHDHSAQLDLINKPKLSSDLEKYAEEMFKESIRTIYNSHKWNTDKKVKNFTFADGVDFGKLKKDLDRLKTAMSSGKQGREVLEAHHSETQFHTTDPFKSKRPVSIAALEQLFKSNFKLKPSDIHSSQKLSDMVISDYLTPPEINSFISTSPFIDKPRKNKRPKTRHSRPNHNSRPKNLETSASHLSFHRRPHHNRNTYDDSRGKENYLDNYPTFTTSSPDMNLFQLSNDRHASNNMDFTLPRTHNFLGWLMKSKQLPPGTLAKTTNDYSDNEYSYYYNDNRRFNDSDTLLHSTPMSYLRYYR